MKIRREELPPNKTANGDPLTMFQMKSLYNSARVPVRGQSDRLSNHFKLGNKSWSLEKLQIGEIKQLAFQQ